MKQKKQQEVIWFINDYAGSPFHGMTYRHYYMAKELKRKGIKPIIITASYSHFLNNYPPIERQQSYLFQKVDMIDYLWLKVLKYKDSRDKKRVLKWFQFCFKLLNLPKELPKPNSIVCSTSAPMMILPAYYLAKKHKAKLIFEIRDIWPLTLMHFKNYSASNPLIYLMQKSVNFGFKKADHIISVLPNTSEYIKEQNIFDFKFTYLPNGISLEELSSPLPLNKETKEQIPKDKFIVGYTGAMGMGDGLDLLIDVANELKLHQEIVFVLIGKGSEKERLKERIKSLKLTNISILDAIPKKEVQSVLQLFNLCYIGWEDLEIYKYGISANKIFDYMYSGKPIVHLFNGKGDLIEQANCGITIKEQNSHKVASAILKLYEMPHYALENMGERGKRFVLKYHTYSSITEKFLTIITKNKEKVLSTYSIK